MVRETSKEAYFYLVESGKLAKANRTVYGHLFHNGPTTQKKTERALGDTTYTMRPRFAQLERMGLIKIVGKEKCEETKRSNILWDVTPRVEPLKDTKKEVKYISVEDAEKLLNKGKRTHYIIDYPNRQGRIFDEQLNVVR